MYATDIPTMMSSNSPAMKTTGSPSFRTTTTQTQTPTVPTASPTKINNELLYDVLSNVLKNYNVDSSDTKKSLLNQDESDCPKPGKELVTTYIRPSKEQTDEQAQEQPEEQAQEEVEKVVVNKTLLICKTKLFPILALVSRTHETFNVKNVLDNDNVKKLILSLFDKTIDSHVI
jgi:hypothetical protein